MRKPATHEPQPHGKTRVAPASTTLLASIVNSSDDAIDVSLRRGAVPGTVEVEVSDRGPGIPPSLAGQIFEPRVRGTTDGGGAGLGLSIAIDGRAVLVALAGDGTYDTVRDAVAGLGLPLLRIEHRRHRLEDLFRDAPVAAGAAVPVPTIPMPGPPA